MTNPDAVGAVARAIWNASEVYETYLTKEEPYRGGDSGWCFNDWAANESGMHKVLLNRASAAISAYESWLAAQAPADVVALVDELIESVDEWCGAFRSSYCHRNNFADAAEVYSHQPETDKVLAARTALLAAVQQRVVVDDEMVERALRAYLEDDFRLVYRKEKHQSIWDGMRAALDAALTTEVDAHGQ